MVRQLLDSNFEFVLVWWQIRHKDCFDLCSVVIRLGPGLLVAVLLELPVPVVKRADLPGLQPPAHQQSLSKIKHSESGKAESYSSKDTVPPTSENFFLR